MDYESQKILFDFYTDQAEKIDKETLYQQHNFDEWLLKLCAGVFGVSFAFIEKLVNFSSAVVKPFLITGWSFFSICIILSIYSFLNTKMLLNHKYKNLWIKYENELSDDNKELKKTVKDKIATFLTVFNFLLFIAGVICLILFISINLMKIEEAKDLLSPQ